MTDALLALPKRRVHCPNCSSGDESTFAKDGHLICVVYRECCVCGVSVYELYKVDGCHIDEPGMNAFMNLDVMARLGDSD